MKNLNTTHAALLSQIKLADRQSASLVCQVKNGTELSLILHDEQGRSRLQKNFSLNAGENNLEFRLPELEAGNYNAWIDVQGQTYIRPIVIVSGSSRTGGILSKFKQWLNFL